MPDNKPTKPAPTRYSTLYSSRIGLILVLSTIFFTGWGFKDKLINEGNVIPLVTTYLFTSAAFFGINLTRRAIENVASINNNVPTSLPVDGGTVTSVVTTAASTTVGPLGDTNVQ